MSLACGCKTVKQLFVGSIGTRTFPRVEMPSIIRVCPIIPYLSEGRCLTDASKRPNLPWSCVLLLRRRPRPPTQRASLVIPKPIHKYQYTASRCFGVSVTFGSRPIGSLNKRLFPPDPGPTLSYFTAWERGTGRQKFPNHAALEATATATNRFTIRLRVGERERGTPHFVILLWLWLCCGALLLSVPASHHPPSCYVRGERERRRRECVVYHH